MRHKGTAPDLFKEGAGAVVYPMFISFDDRGRLFVCESAGKNIPDEEMDRNHEVPEQFLRNFMNLAKGFRSDDVMSEFQEDAPKKEADPNKIRETNRTAAIVLVTHPPD